MKQRYLEVSFRRGTPIAAYLYLPRPREARVAKTVDGGVGLRVDVDENGVPLGIEITDPAVVTHEHLNAVLARHGLEALDADDWAPLAA
jgi:hypothetical protein